MPTLSQAAGLIGMDVKVIGMQTILKKLSPSRVERALEAAGGLGARHLLKAIKADSRVSPGGGTYRDGWRQVKRGKGTRSIINEVEYAPYVRGASQPSTFPNGRRRGAAKSFLRKIKEEETAEVRAIIRERILREFR